MEPFTKLGKTWGGVATGLTGVREHGSTVLLRHVKSEGYSEAQLK